MLSALAHVKWFSEGDETATIANLSTTEWLVVAGFITLGVFIMFLLGKFLRPTNVKLDEKFKNLRDWVPAVVRYSTALLLIFNFWRGYLFAPNISYASGTLYLLISAVLIAVALLLLFGVFTRVAGVGLLVIFFAGLLVANEPMELFDHLEFIGLGLFLMFSGPGKLSVPTQLTDPLEPLSSKDWLASPLLRTFAGLGLIVLAFSEKLMNMTLSNDFLLEYNWNFLSSYGLSDRNFIIAAGIIEVLVGLTLVLNMVPRLGTLALLGVMITTAVLLGVDEIFGHMFAVAVVAAVWVGPNVNLFKKQSSG